ncbi:MAG: ATP-dependent DNA helicase RecG [Armatimonadota bacterium]
MASVSHPASNSSEPSPALGYARSEFDTDIQFMKGVGPNLARVLAKLEILTIGDLLQHYPTRYEDRTTLARVSRLEDGQYAVLRLKVTEVQAQRTGRRGLTIIRVAAEDDTGTLVLVWFNQPWLKDKFVRLRGCEILVYGQVRYGRLGLEMNTPDVEPLGDDEGDPWSYGKFVPVYRLTEGVTQGKMRKLLQQAVEKYAAGLPEALPEKLLDELDLMDINSAAKSIHWAASSEEHLAARKRLVFEEFFHLQIALAQMRHDEGDALPGIAFKSTKDLASAIQSAVPFQLTGGQQRVLKEIWKDMARPHPMNRLVQGDVGSGKTIVAVGAMLLAARNGYQSAMMAPTEVLAEQHFMNIEKLADDLGLRIGLLAGSMTPKAKQNVYSALDVGHIDVVVGTHALVQESVKFHKLGLVVVDEQHKFGVKQRSALRGKGENPDMLVMTATPIPRTLTMTVYGDLDVSIIDELPIGRKPVRTHHKSLDQRFKVYEGVRVLLQKGGQAFVVCPLVSDSEKVMAKAAEDLSEELARDVFPEYSVGLLHGQMKRDEKQSAIEMFRNKQCQVLVATTVIEVGVDVPGASVMVIENAERYGLAQLHQLRGRVGRSDEQAFCVLLSDTNTEDSRRRMEVMDQTNDGFRIAEEDLVIRGPGEFFGVKQSGLPSFKIADVIKDVPLLEIARRKAAELVARDPKLLKPEHRQIRRIVVHKYQQNLLETVG